MRSTQGMVRSESAQQTEIALDHGSRVYEAILRENLDHDLLRLTEFFSNGRRLMSLTRLLATHLHCEHGVVLNVGCGPFATEFFVKSLAQHSVISFDYTQGFAKLFPIFRARGFLVNTSFFIGNAVEVEFRPESFDLIIMHDLFYEDVLLLEIMLEKYDAYLRPHGLLFLDIMDLRTRWIWKLLGKHHGHKRYDLLAVLSLLHSKRYEVVSLSPTLGGKGALDRLFRILLWKGLGLTNNFAILAKKPGE